MFSFKSANSISDRNSALIKKCYLNSATRTPDHNNNITPSF